MSTANQLDAHESLAFWSPDRCVREEFLRSEIVTDGSSFPKGFCRCFSYIMSEIGNVKGRMFRCLGASESVARDSQEILRYNLHYINWLLRGSNGLFHVMRSHDSRPKWPELEDMIVNAMRSEAHDLEWLVRCTRRAAEGFRGDTVDLEHTIINYVKSEETSIRRFEAFKKDAFEVYPYWKNYNISVEVWDLILFSEKRDRILAVLAALDHIFPSCENSGKFVIHGSGLHYLHIHTANMVSGEGAETSFLNAVILDRICLECPIGEILADADREARVSGIASLSTRAPSFWRMEFNSLKAFLLTAPTTERQELRRIVASAGIAVAIACNANEEKWPRVLTQRERGRQWRERKSLLAWMVGGRNLASLWKHATEEGWFSGSWSDCRANTDILCGLDYKKEDADTCFLRSESRNTNKFSVRAENRLVSELVSPI